MSTTNHRRRRPGRFQFIYDGRSLLAVIEQRAHGWHVIADNRDLGAYGDHEAALRFVKTIHPAKKGAS